VASGKWLVDRKGQIEKWYAIVPATLAVVAVAVPGLMASVPQLGFALQRSFSLVCHQQADRSLVLFGGSVAVCARCLGIYLGAAVGLLIKVPRRLAQRFLLVAVSLNLVDWVAELVGVHGNWILLRFALGVTLGAAAAMLVIASNDEVKVPTRAKAA
jgi:uncharacterized membrane protein